MTIKNLLKWLWLQCLPLFLLPLIFNGCAASRPIILADNKITSKGLFTVDPPAGDWRYTNSQVGWHGNRSGTIRDIYLVLCPGPEIITISRSVYRPPLFKNTDDGPDKFMKIALAYLEDNFRFGLNNPVRELKSTSTVSVGDCNAIVVLMGTTEDINDCDRDNKIIQGGKKKILSKFVIIEGGDKHAFWDQGMISPRMIVFQYSSPADTFYNGVEKFDRVVQSFRFLKE